MDEKSLKLDFLVVLTFFIASIINEGALFLFLGFGAFPTYPLFDIGIILIICAILFIIPGTKTSAIIVIILTVIQSFVSCLNISLYKIFGDVFTFDMLTLGNEAAAAFSLNYLFWPAIVFYLIMLSGVVTICVFIVKSYKKSRVNFKNFSIVLALMFFVLSGLGLGFFKLGGQVILSNSTFKDSEYFESDAYLYKTLNVKISAFKKFGSFGLYALSLFSAIEPPDEATDAEQTEAAKNYLANAKTLSELGAASDYYGISQNNNVIVIMVESLEWFAIDPHYTPNLYNLMNNALSFSSYYARNKTNVSEGIGILGSYPKDTQFTTFYRANSSLDKLNLPFSLPNMLKDNNENLITSYFHDYYGYFYGRNMVLPTFGFDNVTCLEKIEAYQNETINPLGLPNEFSDFMLDSIMFENEIENIAPKDKPFYSHITTVTMHGGYNINHPRIEENKQALITGFAGDYNRAYYENAVFPELGYDYTLPTDVNKLEMFFNYKAAAMDTDKAIGILLNYLSSTLDEFDTDSDGNTTESLLDNTTLVIYGDHNTYMTSLTNIMKGLNETDLFTTELYRIPLMIYDKNATTKFITDNGTNIFSGYTNTFNIIPTIMELLGVDYKPDLYQGNSIFQTNYETGFISIIGGIFNDKFFSYDTIDILYESPTATLSDVRKFQRLSNEFYAKQINLERIYKYSKSLFN